jgi:hypothetical protein
MSSIYAVAVLKGKEKEEAENRAVWNSHKEFLRRPVDLAHQDEQKALTQPSLGDSINYHYSNKTQDQYFAIILGRLFELLYHAKFDGKLDDSHFGALKRYVEKGYDVEFAMFYNSSSFKAKLKDRKGKTSKTIKLDDKADPEVVADEIRTYFESLPLNGTTTLPTTLPVIAPTTLPVAAPATLPVVAPATLPVVAPAKPSKCHPAPKSKNGLGRYDSFIPKN